MPSEPDKPLPQRSPSDPWAAAAVEYKLGDPFAAYQKPLKPPAAPSDDWKIWQATSDKPTPQSYAKKLGRNIWNAAKGAGQTAADIGGALNYDPAAAQRVYDGVVQPQVNQGKKAVQAAKGEGEFAGMGPVGRASEAVGHASRSACHQR